MGRQSRHCVDGRGKPRREIVAVASNQPHAGTVAPCQNAEAVTLDFVNPTGSRRRSFAGDGKHGSIIPSLGRVRSRNDMRVLVGTVPQESSQSDAGINGPAN
jgi:hypothetical protein